MVDKSVLESLKELMSELNYDSSFSGFICDLANGDLYEHNLEEEMGISYPVRGDRDWDDETYREERKQYFSKRDEVLNKILGKYGYKHLQQEGGGEGGAEYCFGVFKFQGKIYRTEWSYYSHQGYYYDDIEGTLKEVKPVEKTITVYEGL